MRASDPLISSSSIMDGEELRKKLRHFFHSNRFHYILAGVIVFDLFIVLTDIILLLIYCDDIPHDVEEVVENLVYVSLTILSVFIIELSLQMYAYGLKEWCSSYLHIFDFFIVVVTFVLEIVFHNLNSEKVEATVGLLVGFRLWRLVRVVHVTTEALDLKHESEVDILRDKVEELQVQLSKALGKSDKGSKAEENELHTE